MIEPIISEYILEEGRMNITVKRHSTSEGVRWAIWQGVEWMLYKNGKWRLPDRRKHMVNEMFMHASEAVEFWHSLPEATKRDVWAS